MNKLMNKKLTKKGFTLAELLIVVAIIAVLVAVAIPVFTSQLEKAREATDEANIRAAYAQCASSALTGVAEDGVTVTTTDGVITATKKVKMTQQKAGFAAGDTTTVNIGGVVLDNAKFGLGEATITVKSDGSAPTIVIAA